MTKILIYANNIRATFVIHNNECKCWLMDSGNVNITHVLKLTKARILDAHCSNSSLKHTEPPD